MLATVSSVNFRELQKKREDVFFLVMRMFRIHSVTTVAQQCCQSSLCCASRPRTFHRTRVPPRPPICRVPGGGRVSFWGLQVAQPGMGNVGKGARAHTMMGRAFQGLRLLLHSVHGRSSSGSRGSIQKIPRRCDLTELSMAVPKAFSLLDLSSGFFRQGHLVKNPLA